MKIVKWVLGILILPPALCLLTVGFLWFYLPRASFSASDSPAGNDIISAAEKYLGVTEGTDAHREIIDTYNTADPLPQGYEVKYDDSWCATFVSFAAMKAGVTEEIPLECSCQRQIGLWQELGRWEETDSYLPLSGDIIYYDWDVLTWGDSTGWSDHVGIVVGTWGPFIKVIEGNKDDAVGYRYIIRWDPRIRGYGLPDYP